jgi:hypothetical protein
MENEIWKTIPNFSDYKFSSLGKIVSFKKNRNGRLLRTKESPCRDGYYHACLKNDSGNQVNKAIHVWIAVAFLDNPDPLIYTIVNHKNGIKTDNRIENLEWVTPSQNTQHSFDELNRKGYGYSKKHELFNFEDRKHEDWRKITGYENYMCNALGEIISCTIFGKCTILSPKVNLHGYIRVGLYDSNHRVKVYAAHQIIAQSFIENPDNLPFVNHINGIKTDNRAINLEWCSQKENIKHARDELNALNYRKCENGGSAILTNNQVIEIIELLAKGMTCTAIGKIYNTTHGTISNIKLGKQWIDIPRPRTFEKDIHHHTKITEADAITIYKRAWKEMQVRKEKDVRYDLAAEYGINQASVYDIIYGRSWYMVTGHVKGSKEPNWDLINS